MRWRNKKRRLRTGGVSDRSTGSARSSDQAIGRLIAMIQ